MADPVIAEVEPTVEIPLAESPAPDEQDQPTGAADALPGDAAAAAAATAVREATAAGWVPKEQWTGPPNKWKPAEDFLHFRDSVLPLVQKENRALREENKAFKARLERLETADRERAERSEQLSVETLKFERQQAAENGDWAKVGDLDDKLIAAKVKEATKPKAAEPVVDREEGNRIFAEFVSDNAWAAEPKMQQILAETLITMRQAGTPLAGRELLEEAKDRVRRLYPERFTAAPRRERPPSFSETGGNNGSNRGTVRGWNDLKPEVQQALEPLIGENGITKAGLLKRCAEKPADYFRH
jgi:hypothetical protein